MNTLGTLPPISFAPSGPDTIEQAILSGYETISKSTLYPGDPVRLFLESLAYTLTLQGQLIDLAGRQNLLAFATQAHLDHLGALMGTARLEQCFARCVLRFELAEPLQFAVPIPQGTRVTTQDRGLTFITDQPTEILPGETAVDSMATASTPGMSANGLLPGQLCRLVDPVAYVAKVANTKLTLGGADVESDEHYRERIHLAPEAYTCAGSEGSYRYHVLAVHRDIAEVAVWSPKPGTVDIRPVLSGGEIPSPELLEEIRRKVSADTVRPLTDTVIVAAPEPVEYAVRGGWWLRRSDSALSGSVQRAIDAALEDYRLWQRCQPGRDINPTKLIARLERAGAKRVELSEPMFTKLEGWQIARETEINIEFMGVEEE